MSKSGSDTLESEKYRAVNSFNSNSTAGGYNTLKSTLKSNTISSIPEAEEADTSTSEEARVYKRLDDLGYDDSDLESNDYNSDITTSQDEYPVITTKNETIPNFHPQSQKQPSTAISLSKPKEIDYKTTKTETKASNCQTSGDFMKEYQDKENMIKILKKELESKDNQIISFRSEMEIEQRKKWNVADESTQTIFNVAEKGLQVKIEDIETEELLVGVQKLKKRNQELETDLLEKQEEIDQLNTKIKVLKKDILNVQNEESNNVVLQKHISKLSKQISELQADNDFLQDELKKHEELMNYTQSHMETSDLHTTKTADLEFESLKKQHETNDKFLKEYQKQNEKLTRENKELSIELKTVRNELEDLKRKRALNEKDKDEIQILHHKIRDLEKILHLEREEFDSREDYLKDQIVKIKNNKEELEINLRKLDPQKLEEQRNYILNFEEKVKCLEREHNEKMMELCRRLKIQQEIQEQYEQQSSIINQQERQISIFKNKIREIESSLFDMETRLREKERENRELRSDNSDLWKEKKDISRNREQLLELEKELQIREEKISSFPREIEKIKREYEKKIGEADLKVKKVESKKEELEIKLKETKEYYLKKQKELNDVAKLSVSKKVSGTIVKRIPEISIESDSDFLKDELKAKQLTIDELNQKLLDIDKNGHTVDNSFIGEGKINEDNELMVEIGKIQREKEETQRKLEVSEMNKTFIKENAMEQVKAVYNELNTLREKYRHDMQNMEDRHQKELRNQESSYLQEIEDYKKMIDGTVRQTQHQQIDISSESSRIHMLKQLVSRIENLESKHKIKEMELERELNETKYRYELKLSSMKQQLDLTIQQKNQQVLHLKTSLDNLDDDYEMLSTDDSDDEDSKLKNALSSALELSNSKPNFNYSFHGGIITTPNIMNMIHMTSNDITTHMFDQPIDSPPNTNMNISDRLLHLKEGLNFNERYKHLLQNEIEKIEEAQRNVGTIQRDIRKELIQRQKGPPMSLYPSRKNLCQNNGKISKKLACEYFVNMAQSKLKASGSSAIVIDDYNTRILQSAAIASKGTDKPKKSKKILKKKKRNTEDEEYISESEFQSDDDYEEEMENEDVSADDIAENSIIIKGPAPNPDTVTRQEFLKVVPLVFDTKKWSNNEIKNIRYAVRLQHQEIECKRVFETYKGDSSLLKKEFEKVKNMSGEELENIESSKIDWEKVAKFYVKTRKSEECRKFWEIELARDIKKENWSKEEDINLLYVADDFKGHDWEKITNSLYENQPLKRRPIHCFRRYQRSLNTNMMRSKWTEEEDRKLMEAVKSFGEKNWQQIANQLEERTGQQCLHRWMKTLNPAIKRGRWTVEEDKRLLMAVNAYPSNNWVLVNRHTPGRTDVQCRERWCNILNPVLNVGPWTKEEDESLKRAIKDLGAGNWSKIAEVMHPRTDNQCWRRWRLISSEEVSDYRKKIYKREKALVKNFVGREKERPDITADDLQITHPESDNNMIQMSIGEFVERQRSLVFSQNSLLSVTICKESMQSLQQSLNIPKLKSILEIEWQRMDQIRFLLEKTPYFVGVPPSNILKRVMSLLFTLKTPLPIKRMAFPVQSTRESRLQHFKNHSNTLETPIFSLPCIVPSMLSFSLPTVPASSVSLNSLATLQDVLYGRGSPKKGATCVKVVDLESRSEQMSTFQIPIFQSTTKDWVYEPPTLVHNNASILHTPEFKTLAGVFNALFQKPLQQTIGKIAERLPHLLRRVPHADLLNKSMEQSQTNYQNVCQTSKDPFIIQQSKWETEQTLSDPPTFSTIFSLYHHLPTDDSFNRNELGSLPQAPLILLKPKGVRGRPKGSKNKKTLELERQRKEAALQNILTVPSESAQPQPTSTTDSLSSQKRGRGRPKGSKNKPKTLEQLTEQKKKQLNKPVVRKVSKNQTGSSKKRKTSQTTDLTLESTIDDDR